MPSDRKRRLEVYFPCISCRSATAKLNTWARGDIAGRRNSRHGRGWMYKLFFDIRQLIVAGAVSLLLCLSLEHNIHPAKQAKGVMAPGRCSCPPHLPWLARDGLKGSNASSASQGPISRGERRTERPAPSTRPAGGSSYACESCMKCLGRRAGGCRGWIAFDG